MMMRATRGLWAAVGAGTSLAAAGLLALFSVSVVLAVRGWPQVSRADGSRSVALRAHVATPDASGSAAAAAPAPVVLPARSGATRTSRGSNSTPRRGATHHGAGRPAPRRPGSIGSAPSGSKITPSSSAGTPAPSGSGSTNPIAQLPHTVSTTVTNVTDAAGAALQPVSPAVAQTVTTTGQQAGDAIDQVGKAVDGVVGGLTGG